MVAKVITGKTIRGALNYNETKVVDGTARCIMANQFGCKPEELSFSHKLSRFQKLIVRNPKTKTNTVHISLNFDITENLTTEKLSSIASTYMDKIGFGDQPFLVYQHFDAAHPHIHILSTNIQSDSKRIDLHNIGRNQSEKARKEIESEFNLVKAESKTKKINLPGAASLQKAHYGKSQTKRTISNIVLTVARTYRYTSLPEFNAALKQFNVVAFTGKEGTEMYKRKGLSYSIIDAKGIKKGIPIKASSIYTKPMLPFLEKQFRLNEALRQPAKDRLKACIEKSLHGKSITMEAFKASLQKENVYLVARQTNTGEVYGLTFVDNLTRVVFNGSDLGKPYSAKAILQQISDSVYPQQSTPDAQLFLDDQRPIEFDMGVADLLANLTTAQPIEHISPNSATRKRRRKKGKSK
jgi:hypothetical protein